MNKYTSMCAAVVMAAGTASYAATVDVDMMFVIDQSGSMSNEFSTLATNIDIVFNGLSSAPEIGSFAAGLVSYENVNGGDLTLHQPLTTSASTLGTALASVPVFGGFEEALSAVDSVLPGGSLHQSAGWRSNTVKTVVLITDEDADDETTYTNAFGTGYAALGAKLDSVNYLNNIITLSGLFSEYEPASRPIGTPGEYKALFDLNSFTGPNADPIAFLTAFTATKLSEITTGGVVTPGDGDPATPVPSPVPLPAGMPLLLAGLAGFGVIRMRKRKD